MAEGFIGNNASLIRSDGHFINIATSKSNVTIDGNTEKEYAIAIRKAIPKMNKYATYGFVKESEFTLNLLIPIPVKDVICAYARSKDTYRRILDSPNPEFYDRFYS